MKRQEAGLTFIELLVALAISAIILVGIVGTSLQIIKLTAKSNHNIQAVSQLENAGTWIVRDGMQATVVTVGGYPGNSVILTLQWDYSTYDPTQTAHIVVYSLHGTVLTRTDNSGPALTIAGNITAASMPTGNSITLTATVGGFQPSSKTLTYYFMPRLTNPE